MLSDHGQGRGDNKIVERSHEQGHGHYDEHEAAACLRLAAWRRGLRTTLKLSGSGDGHEIIMTLLADKQLRTP